METVILQRKRIHVGNLILVNAAHGYVEEAYGNLEPVQRDGPHILLERRAALLLSGLIEKINGRQGIVPVSGWRSLQEQQRIWDDSLMENGRAFTEKYVAIPGHSEHQTGLAIDLGLKQENIDFIRPEFPAEGVCGRFRTKAPAYGFIERYPSGKEDITGIAYEPWHFRYVGIPHAMIMVREKLTLEEYISFIKDFPYGEKTYVFEKEGKGVFVSYLKAGPEDDTVLAIKESYPYTVSGNNVDGFIITQYGAKV